MRPAIVSKKQHGGGSSSARGGASPSDASEATASSSTAVVTTSTTSTTSRSATFYDIPYPVVLAINSFLKGVDILRLGGTYREASEIARQTAVRRVSMRYFERCLPYLDLANGGFWSDPRWGDFSVPHHPALKRLPPPDDDRHVPSSTSASPSRAVPGGSAWPPTIERGGGAMRGSRSRSQVALSGSELRAVVRIAWTTSSIVALITPRLAPPIGVRARPRGAARDHATAAAARGRRQLNPSSRG